VESGDRIFEYNSWKVRGPKFCSLQLIAVRKVFKFYNFENISVKLQPNLELFRGVNLEHMYGVSIHEKIKISCYSPFILD